LSGVRILHVSGTGLSAAPGTSRQVVADAEFLGFTHSVRRPGRWAPSAAVLRLRRQVV